MKDTMNLGKINPQEREFKKIEKKTDHIPSKIHPDTLFTFTTRLEYLLKYLKNRMISPRYCDEDIGYLKIMGMRSIAYPMKCFCDINMQKLDVHMAWYGDYGIAFYKSWGMERNIQPVHYLNEKADLRNDISKVFRAVLREDVVGTKTHEMLKDYLLHELMYYKPYQGKIMNRKTGKVKKKCFADECEWRFIPDVSSLEFPQVIPEQSFRNSGLTELYSNSMELKKEVSLCFEYSDIKHIIVQTVEEYKELSLAIDSWEVDDKEEILSKVIVWQQKREDF